MNEQREKPKVKKRPPINWKPYSFERTAHGEKLFVFKGKTRGEKVERKMTLDDLIKDYNSA